MLGVFGLGCQFGGLKALDDVSLSVTAQQITGLIGPNGAGKTTLFNIITGLLTPSSGTIQIDGRAVSDLRPHRLAQFGIARTFQNIRLFNEMSVIDNVITAMHASLDYGFGALLFAPWRARHAERSARDAAMALLERVHLADAAERLAANLPYGAQRRLELARALATRPRLLLLDEPVAGMNPAERAELMQLLRTIHADGIGILIIEHDMHFIMNLCDTVAVLNFGRLIATGTPAEVQRNAAVIEAYLGVDHGAA